jgi:stage II sporulation protein D
MLLLRLIPAVLLFCSAAHGFSGKKPKISPLASFEREIPVQLYEGCRARIEALGSVALECYRGVKLSEVYYFSSNIDLQYRENGIEVSDHNGQLTFGLTEVRCKPRDESTYLAFDGKTYRGYIRGIYKDKPGGIILLNMVDLEDYLMGVLPGEIGERTEEEFEAAKAQAVAARTYAVWKLTDDESSGKLSPTIADQLYLGKDSEIELLSRAIMETAGEIMTYDGHPIAAYYHAVCGGRTSAIEDVWPEKGEMPYLVGTDDDDYCTWAKTYSWTETFDSLTLRENLTAYFAGRAAEMAVNFDKLVDIEFITDGRSGRVIEMRILTETDVFTVERDQIRWALGRPSSPGAILPSTKFRTVKTRGRDGVSQIVIIGTGNGHGVGACQCGAIGRARAGQKYDEILKTYYKRIKIEKIY